MKVRTKKAKAVVLLHDTLEDSAAFTIEDFDFLDREQKESLLLLTHNKSIPYFECIEKIKQNMLAKEVKQQDLLQNINLNRLKNITTKDIARVKKYTEALEILNSQPLPNGKTERKNSIKE